MGTTSRVAWIALAAVAFAACDHLSRPTEMAPGPEELRILIRDSSYRIPSAEKAKIAPGFDVSALERLLGMVRPDFRTEILAHFQVQAEGEKKRGALVEFTDPQLQAVLEEVWAPMWDDASDQALEEGWYFYPGREIAKQRRYNRIREQKREPGSD